MGSCQCTYQSHEYQHIIKSEEENTVSRQIREKQVKKNTGSRTSLYSLKEKIDNNNTQCKLQLALNNLYQPDQNQVNLSDTIGDEMEFTDQNKLPPFIRGKNIQQSEIIRSNRFLEDLEFEVRMKIKELQFQEKQNQSACFNFQLSSNNSEQLIPSQQDSNEPRSLIKKALQQTPSINDALPSSEQDLLQSNPFQIAKTLKQSQFAPQKSENNMNTQKSLTYRSQKSQISKNTVTSRSLKSQISKKSPISSHLKDAELNSNFASRGSDSNENSQQKCPPSQNKGLEKMFSDLYPGEKSIQEQKSNQSQDARLKSILKSQSFSKQDLSRSVSNKSCYTNRSQIMQKNKKRVRFSQDTNFNYERKYPKQMVQEISNYDVWW